MRASSSARSGERRVGLVVEDRAWCVSGSDAAEDTTSTTRLSDADAATLLSKKKYNESRIKFEAPGPESLRKRALSCGAVGSTAQRDVESLGAEERNDEREKRIEETEGQRPDQYTFAGFATSVLNIEPTKSAMRVELIATTLKGMLASTMGTGTIAASV